MTIDELTSEQRQARLAASREVDKEVRASQLAHRYRVELTGEEWGLLAQATMLNRRMLDRSPEHEFLDRALTLVMERARESWLSTEECLLLTNKSRAVWGIGPLDRSAEDGDGV